MQKSFLFFLAAFCKGILIGFILSSLSSVAQAQHVSTLFEQANNAFFDKNFEQASSFYRALIEAGVEDPDVYYNLALSELRQEKIGYAIYALEKSLRLTPEDEETYRLLTQLYKRMEANQLEEKGSSVENSEPSISRAQLWLRKHSETFFWVFLISNFLAFFAFAIRLWSSKLRTFSLFLASSLLGVMLVSLSLGIYAKGWLGSENFGIVLQKETPMIQSPHPRSSETKLLQEGQKVQVLERYNEYLEVYDASDNSKGWTLSKNIGEL